MITPDELRKKLLQRYRSFLKELVSGALLFPYRPKVNLSLDYRNHAEALSQIRALEDHSKPRRGFGYIIEYKTMRTRAYGTQTSPESLIFETPDDLFRFIGRKQESDEILQLLKQTRAEFPISDQWVKANLFLLLRYRESWPDIIASVRQLLDLGVDIDLSRLHSRALPLTFDSKFIERHNTPICKLLEEISKKSFDLGGAIYSEEFNVWIRFHRSTHSFYNAQLGIFPIKEFASMDIIPAEQILIIENKTTFIQPLPHAIASPLDADPGKTTLLVWGQGNACLSLKQVPWLHEKRIYYWGDMDLHGLAILGNVRRFLPHTQSLGMDFSSYTRYAQFAVQGEMLERGSWYDYLSPEERKLAEYLISHPKESRIEQERLLQG